MFHKALTDGDIHKVMNWTVANAAARTALAVTIQDIGKVIWQQDTDVFYVLKNNVGPVWLAMNAASIAPCAFSAYASAATSMPSGVYTKILFQTEEYDYSNFYDTALSRYTPGIPGIYHFTSGISVITNGATLAGGFTKNGAYAKLGNYDATATHYNANWSASIYLNGTTDYVECVWMQSAATQDCRVAATTTYFQGHLVARTA